MACKPNNRILCAHECRTCYNKSFASYEKSKYWSKKNTVTPRQVMPGSSKKYIFDCTCGHEFTSTLNNVTNGKWCPYCAYSNCKLCDNDECDNCLQRSFAYHPKADYWSNKNTLNPREVALKSNITVIFDCDNCTHDFSSKLSDIYNGNWCPYCAKHGNKICGVYDCNTCLIRSFANHPKADYWSNKNKIDPWKILRSSNKIFLFDCPCGHEFSTNLYNIVNNEQWCPYCCVGGKICDDIDCKICIKKSFAIHPNAQYWSVKNKINPRQVSLHSGQKYLFDCNICDCEFSSSIYHIANGQWCPKCKNKTETKLFNALRKLGYDIKFPFRPEWCKNSSTCKYLPFDMAIPKYNIIIELDGIQHFKQVSNWKSPEDQLTRDMDKMEMANNNGYTVIRVLQEDVWYDKNDWLTIIQKHIKMYQNPTRIYLSEGTEYDSFTNMQ